MSFLFVLWFLCQHTAHVPTHGPFQNACTSAATHLGHVLELFLRQLALLGVLVWVPPYRLQSEPPTMSTRTRAEHPAIRDIRMHTWRPHARIARPETFMAAGVDQLPCARPCGRRRVAERVPQGDKKGPTRHLAVALSYGVGVRVARHSQRRVVVLALLLGHDRGAGGRDTARSRSRVRCWFKPVLSNQNSQAYDSTHSGTGQPRRVVATRGALHGGYRSRRPWADS